MKRISLVILVIGLIVGTLYANPTVTSTPVMNNTNRLDGYVFRICNNVDHGGLGGDVFLTYYDLRGRRISDSANFPVDSSTGLFEVPFFLTTVPNGTMTITAKHRWNGNVKNIINLNPSVSHLTGGVGVIMRYFHPSCICQIDLVAQGPISGQTMITVNQPAQYTFTVFNAGPRTVTNFTVNLRTSYDYDLVTIAGSSIAPGISRSFTLTWTPTSTGYYSITGYIDCHADINLSNNFTSNTLNVNVVSHLSNVRVGFATNTPHRDFSCIRQALAACRNNGTVQIAPGYYHGPLHSNNIWPQNKNITVRGSSNPDNPTVMSSPMCCVDPFFIFNDIDDRNRLEHITFYGSAGTITLTRSNPVLAYLTFEELTQPFEIDNHDLYQQILHCDFRGSAVSIKVDKLDMIGCNFSGRPTCFSTYLYSFNVDRLLLKNVRVDTQARINIFSTHNLANNSYLRISDSKFEASDVSIPSLNITNAGRFRNISIERSIFTSPSMNAPLLRLSELNNISNIQAISFVNNTFISNNNQMVSIDVPSSFNVDIRNTLFRGNLHVVQNQNNINISHSWFNHANNMTGNSLPVFSEKNVGFGDPQIDPTTLQPIWTQTVKSPLIDWGHRDTNANMIPWWNDPEDRDYDGTRRDIGAVTAMAHGAITHTIVGYSQPTPHDPGTGTVRNTPQYAWVCFPFIDGLYQGGFVRDGQYYDVKDLVYNFQFYNQNNLFSHGADVIWYFNDDDGDYSTIKTDPTKLYELPNITRNLESKHGYKIRKRYPNDLPILEPFVLETAGFRIGGGTHNEPGNSITIQPPQSPDVEREILVGYFKTRSERPLYALSQITSQLTEIKTRHWSLNKINGAWHPAQNDYRLNFGEAVSLTFVGTSPATFTWQLSQGTEPPKLYSHPLVSHFEYEEEDDYIPIYVTIPDEFVGDQTGEIGLFIDGVCYGAEVITGEIAQINAYIINSDIDFDNAVVEFHFHEYFPVNFAMGPGANAVSLTRQHQIDSRKLDLGARNRFYQISLKADDVDNSGSNLQIETTLIGNYPNPFNPSTTISYSLSEAGITSLQIFNIKGQLVRTLVNDVRDPGDHTVVWNGEDNSAKTVPSGIYFYRLETSNSSHVKKMLLMK
jgi:hypothetical protein